MQIYYNWPAVAVATLLGIVLHALWFSPLLLGGLWQRKEGLNDEQVRTGLLPRLGLAALASAAMALALAGFFNFTGSNTFLQGVLAGAQLSLGLVLPAQALALVMGRKGAGLLALHLGLSLLNAVLVGGLLAAWR